MKTNDLSHEKIKQRVAIIGRWMPIHNGHKEFLIKLARESEKILIMIGSCYRGGDLRYSISATERKKMLTAIMKAGDIPAEKYQIVTITDAPTFEEWIMDVLDACSEFGATHFCTGNREDILDILEKKKMDIGLEFINPECYSDFPYRATDIRNFILKGEYEKIEKYIPNEVKPILFRYSFKEIVAASKDRGINFIPGRQTVDLILVVRDENTGKVYVLMGKRPKDKMDFPGMLAFPGGGIKNHETPIDAAIREFYEETGIKLEMVDDSMEPAIVKFADIPQALEQMYIVGNYGTEDETLNGTRGGSSQCFAILVEGDLKQYQNMIKPTNELDDVKFYDVDKIAKKKFAYQHKDMLNKAISMLEAYPDLQKSIPRHEEKKDTFVISFVGASGTGKSTAAFGTMYNLKLRGMSVEYVDEFAKHLVYTDMLEKYIPNQPYIISQQYKSIYDLLGKVDYVVSDAGLQITALHSAGEKVVENLAWYLSDKINQYTILIERDTEKVKFEEENRLEDEEESRIFGEKLEAYLKSRGAQYVKVKGSDKAVEKAIQIIEEREARRSAEY